MIDTIKKITAEEILDSRGNPTISVSVSTKTAHGAFAVPSGASTGTNEALELRDGDKNYFNGLGVKKAIEKVSAIISPALLGFNVADQKKIDSTLLALDGTANKTNLGGNAMIGTSIACAKAAAANRNVEVFEYLRALETMADSKLSPTTPRLYMNLINGGKHASTRLAFQEYHIVPETDNVAEALEIGLAIDHALAKILVSEFGAESAGLGDEGGFALDVVSIRKPLELLSRAILETGNSKRVRLALDVAASSLYSGGLGKKMYRVGGENLALSALLNLYAALINDFKLISIEDPFFEEDFADFHALLSAHPDLLVVGDDLTVTNKTRLKSAIEQKSVNAIIIKPNQIGTLTETLATMKLARENDIECIVSHRSGETNDDFIADLAFAFHCFGLKAGAPVREERLVKYNRLVHVSELAGKQNYD